MIEPSKCFKRICPSPMVSRLALNALFFFVTIIALPVEADEADVSVCEIVKAQDHQLSAVKYEIDQIGTAVSTLRTESPLLKDTLKYVLASQAAQHEVARAQIIDQAIKAIAKLPPDSIDDNLKQRILECMTDTKSATADLDRGTKIVASCAHSETQDILTKLNKAKDESVQAWKACRKTLEGAGQPVTIPPDDDPTWLSVERIEQTEKLLAALQDEVKSTTGAAKDCVGNLRKAFKQVQGQEAA